VALDTADGAGKNLAEPLAIPVALCYTLGMANENSASSPDAIARAAVERLWRERWGGAALGFQETVEELVRDARRQMPDGCGEQAIQDLVVDWLMDVEHNPLGARVLAEPPPGSSPAAQVQAAVGMAHAVEGWNRKMPVAAALEACMAGLEECCDLSVAEGGPFPRRHLCPRCGTRWVDGGMGWAIEAEAAELQA
jgi:hypothetical protein